MDQVGSILPKVLRKRGLHLQADAAQVTFRAQEWLGKALPSLLDHLCVRSLSHATLTIETSHSTVAQECQPLLPGLLQYLQKEFPRVKIEEIRLIRGKK